MFHSIFLFLQIEGIIINRRDRDECTSVYSIISLEQRKLRINIIEWPLNKDLE